MLLNDALVAKAKAKKSKIDSLIESNSPGFFSNLVVDRYITNDDIPNVSVNGVSTKADAQVFFKEYDYWNTYDVSRFYDYSNPDVKKNIEAFKTAMPFPFDFKLHFAKDFLVVEILGKIKSDLIFKQVREFLVLRDAGYYADNPAERMLSSGALSTSEIILENPQAELLLNIKISNLLNYLNSKEKKKRFIFF